MAPDRVHISGDPRGTIGQGIALVPLLRFQAESGKKDLKRARNTVQQEITAAIVQCCSSHFKEIAKAVATVFVVDELTPLVNELRGAVDLWSIGDVKAKLAARATAFGSVAIGLAKQREPQLKAQLQSVMQQHLGKWLLNHGIRWEPASNLGQVDVNDSIPQIVTPGSHRLLLGAAAAITTLVTMTVIANVCGGAGLALILTGPYGLVIGALIGLAMSVLVIVYGWQRAQESIESLTVPKVFRSMILPAGFADSMLPRLEAELVNKMNEQLAQQLPAISQDVDDAIRNVVDHLDWINSLSR
jgi:hypothetical protein